MFFTARRSSPMIWRIEEMPFSIHYLLLAIQRLLLDIPVRARCYPLLIQKANPEVIIKSIGCQTGTSTLACIFSDTARSLRHPGRFQSGTTIHCPLPLLHLALYFQRHRFRIRSLRHPGRFQSGTTVHCSLFTVHCSLSTVHCPYCIWPVFAMKD